MLYIARNEDPAGLGNTNIFSALQLQIQSLVLSIKEGARREFAQSGLPICRSVPGGGWLTRISEPALSASPPAREIASSSVTSRWPETSTGSSPPR
jgi:hypothetical protein